jgi:phage gp37-like protein
LAQQCSKENNDHPTLLLLYTVEELWRTQRAGCVALALVTWRLVPMAAGSSASHIACMVAKTPKET